MAPVVITHSDISRFLQCRRLWHWSYVKDWQPKLKLHGPLSLGSRVHAAIEQHYASGGTADPKAYHDELGMLDVDTYTSFDRPSWELDQLYEDIIIGRNCVVAYMEWLADTGADAPFETVAVEHISEAPLLDGKVLLRGKVDTLFRNRDDGTLVIHDLKTSTAWQGSQREILERSYQHHCYIITESVANPTQYISGAMYTVVKKVLNLGRVATTPVERFRVPATTRQAPYKRAQIEAICLDMLRVMEDGSEPYPTPQQACRWCEYAAPCELQDENPAAAEALLRIEYLHGGRHDRYDEKVET